MNRLGKKVTLDSKSEEDRKNIFIEIHELGQILPRLASIYDIFNNVQHYNLNEQIDNLTLVIDENTKKLKVNVDNIILNNVKHISFSDQNINYNKPPNNSVESSGINVTMDDNYLYVWVKNRWKRIALNEFI